MSIKRWNAKIDSTQADIVKGLRKMGVQVWLIGQPCDLLCYYWSNPLQRFLWQPLEVKTPQGKLKPKARIDKRQQEQRKFLAETRTPVVLNLSEALACLGLCDFLQPTSVSCTSKPLSAPIQSAAVPSRRFE